MDYTAELRAARKHEYSDGEYYLIGQVFNDSKERFADGEWIHTSLVKSVEGDIYTTLNNKYKVEMEKNAE